MEMPVLSALNLADALLDCANQWSIGCYGAIGEFMRGENEPCVIDRTEAAISLATRRGAMAIRLDAPYEAVPQPTRNPDARSIAYCLPEHIALMERRRSITELAPDTQALRKEDCGAMLFDIGIGAPHVTMLLRTGNRDLAEALRRRAGQPYLDVAKELAPVSLEAQPHRIFLSALGRLEVYQPIPRPGEQSPEGPHTHLLPGFLRKGLAHGPDSVIPAGRYAGLMMYRPGSSAGH